MSLRELLEGKKYKREDILTALKKAKSGIIVHVKGNIYSIDDADDVEDKEFFAVDQQGEEFNGKYSDIEKIEVL